MYYVYFVFAGYRVSVGRSKALKGRIISYQRTHRDVFLLGVIECETEKEMKEKEMEVLKKFAGANDFRDMFFLTPDMIDFIVSHTTTLTFKWAGRKESRAFDRKSRNSEYQRKYFSKPENKARQKEYQRQWRENNRERVKALNRKSYHKRKKNPKQLELFGESDT